MRLLAPLLLLLLLPACEAFDKDDAIDQGAHFGLGYAMACSRVPWVSPERAVELVMEWAEDRENDQHPDRCGDNCVVDLKSWRAGAEAGALCPLSE